jgi:NDP-sugar pyrophosphorylase family protein
VQAVILAGGLGTRLRSVIGGLPKSLAPIQGRPFLEYQIESLRAACFKRLVLCIGYKHELIQAHFGDGTAYGVQIAYSVEQQALGTAGALRQAQPYLDDTFLVLNGDTYFAADLSLLLASHMDARSLGTMALVHVTNAGRFGCVSLNDDGYVAHFDEKGSHGPGLINAGVYVFSSAIFHHLTGQMPLSLEMQVFPALARQRLLHGRVLEGYHIDIGTPESYEQFQKDMALGRVPRESETGIKP